MIGIIGALSEEVMGLRSILTNRIDKEVGGTTFTFGEISGKEVVVALSGVGKVNASITASFMLATFKDVKAIINIGVAGGLLASAKQGDLILAKASLQHDFTLNSDEHPRGQIAGYDFVEFKSDEYLISMAENTLKAGENRFIEGIIATGDEFINSASKAEWLRNSFNAAACDMESAAIAQVCYRMKIPFLSLRAVSDSGDDCADLSFNEWLPKAASINIAFVSELIKIIDESKLISK